MKKSFFVFITLSVFSLIFTGCESAGIILGGISQGLNNSVGGSSSPSYSTSSTNSTYSSYNTESSMYRNSLSIIYSVSMSIQYEYFNGLEWVTASCYTTFQQNGFSASGNESECRSQAESWARISSERDIAVKNDANSKSDYVHGMIRNIRGSISSMSEVSRK